MAYPYHYLSFNWIVWEPPTELPSNFDYIHGVQVSLSRAALDQLTFDVRCRLHIHNEDDVRIFTSLLEVHYRLFEHDLSADLLEEYIMDATDLYLEEFDVKKKTTSLKGLSPTWKRIEDWRRVVNECIEQLPPRKD